MNNDLISREALKKAVINSFDNLQAYFTKDFIEEIDNAPTVEPEIPTELCKGCRFLKDCETCEDKVRQQGEWKLHGMIYYCSVCGHDYEQGGNNFCGNCGAKMKGGAE